MLKRFRFGGQDSITNPNPNIIRLTKNHESESEYSGCGGKDSNPNPNRIRIFVTTLSSITAALQRDDGPSCRRP